MPLRRNILIMSLLALALSQGCLYIAPIDEDPEPEDTPPFVNALNGVSPSMGLVNINLSLGGNQEFVISGYGDANLDQTLYHRIVIDYRTAGVAANPSIRSFQNASNPTRATESHTASPPAPPPSATPPPSPTANKSSSTSSSPTPPSCTPRNCFRR